MTACDEPLHTGGKHQSDSERRRGIANETGELVPNRQHHYFSYLAESCFKRASIGFLARDQFGHGHAHGGEDSVHFTNGDDGFHRFGQRCHALAELGHDHRPLTAICTARLGRINEREHLLCFGNTLDDARDGNDFAGIIAGIGGE